jgi:hypothetical protein
MPPPFCTRYVTRVFKALSPLPQIMLRVMYTRVFHCLIFLLFHHRGKMSSIWRPFTYLGDHYVDKVVVDITYILSHTLPGRHTKNQGEGSFWGGTSHNTLGSFASSSDFVVRRPLEAQNDHHIVGFHYAFTLVAQFL